MQKKLASDIASLVLGLTWLIFLLVFVPDGKTLPAKELLSFTMSWPFVSVHLAVWSIVRLLLAIPGIIAIVIGAFNILERFKDRPLRHTSAQSSHDNG